MKKYVCSGVSRGGYYLYQQHKDVSEKDATLAAMIAECKSVRGKPVDSLFTAMEWLY